MNFTLHKDRYTFLIISRSVLIRMRNVSDQIVEKIKTYTFYAVNLFQKFVQFVR